MNNNIRTLRGRLETADVKRIVVDDGRPNHGYRVLDFRVWPKGTSGDACYAILGTQYDMPAEGDAGDNRQIAWAASGFNTGTQNMADAFSIVDPDHVVITDLYILTTTPNDDCNYLIVVEPITMTDDQAILRLIKERSQDDIRE
jgi:hypothetical protein